MANEKDNRYKATVANVGGVGPNVGMVFLRLTKDEEGVYVTKRQAQELAFRLLMAAPIIEGA